MTSTLARASLRHLTRHPWQMGLSVIGIALGVAVVLSIDLANESAQRAFALFTESVAGRATHQVVGGPSGVPEDVYRRLRVDLGIRDAAPVVERDVAVPGHAGVALHLLGIDPFAERPFRAVVDAASIDDIQTLSALLTRPGAALLTTGTARDLGLVPGDPLVVRVGATHRRLLLVGELRPRDGLSARAFESLLVTDIATAQETLGTEGRLSRIDLRVSGDAAGRAGLARVGTILPAGTTIVRAGAASDAAEQMTRAFRINLQALSLLALVVGLFLIYNTMTFSVVQRRELLGTLRALGVTRGEVLRLVLGEAAVVGVAATLLGLPLGVVLGRGLLRLVTQTLNDLYLTVTVTGLAVPATSLVKAAALGLVGTLVAALPAAFEATTTAPRAVQRRSAIETRARRASPYLAVAGVVVGIGGWALLRSSGGLALAYAGLFAILLGAALLTPATTVVLMRALRHPMGWVLGLPGRMAAAGVAQALSRTSVALAALMVAVACTVGVSVMIGSFRQTVVQWLATSLQADVYVSAPSLVSSRPEATLDPVLVDRLRAVPDVGRVSALRTTRVQSPAGPVRLIALDTDPRGFEAFTVLAGDPRAARHAVASGEAVLVSEPFARRRHVAPGTALRLLTDRGEHVFPVAGVYADYGSSEGVVLVARATYDRFWNDRAVSSLGLDARPGIDADTLVTELRRAAGPDSDALIRSNQALRDASLAVFDRTFQVTVVLRYLATIVAFVGVVSALMALALERERELAVLRAQGFTPAQVWTLVTTQTGLMGLVAGLLALPLGVVLALVLIFVVNQRSFGWTLHLEVDPWTLGQALLLAVAAALAAGLYPARRMARLPLPAALRGE